MPVTEIKQNYRSRVEETLDLLVKQVEQEDVCEIHACVRVRGKDGMDRYYNHCSGSEDIVRTLGIFAFMQDEFLRATDQQ